jgi:hypothetical protein
VVVHVDDVDVVDDVTFIDDIREFFLTNEIVLLRVDSFLVITGLKYILWTDKINGLKWTGDGPIEFIEI